MNTLPSIRQSDEDQRRAEQNQECNVAADALEEMESWEYGNPTGEQ